MLRSQVVLMLWLCMLGVLIHTQDTDNDDTTIKQIANIPGCRIWDENVC